MLGMINYYAKFLYNLSCILSPLYNLLKANVKWHWDAKCNDAFIRVKEMLISAPILVHYNPNYELQLITDASPVGVGAVLCHKFPDGQVKPISFASRTLSDAEKNWKQIEREGLAIIFGISKFNQYLYGQKFTLVCDNKHIISIFNPSKWIPQTV